MSDMESGIEEEDSMLPVELNHCLDAVGASVPFSGTFGFKTELVYKTELLDVLRWQTSVHNSLTALQTSIAGTHSDTQEVGKYLEAALKGVEATENFAIRMLKEDPFNMAPSQYSGEIAQEVFNIPELAEMIMILLPAKAVFHATRANRAFANCLKSSHKLQTKLGIHEADSEVLWRCHFGRRYATHDEASSLAGVYLELRAKDCWGATPRGQVEISGNICMSRFYNDMSRPKPAIVSRVRSILMCQPPLYEVKVKPPCCGDRMHPILITSKGGVTIGDLLDAEEKMCEEHRLCPFASPSRHNLATREVACVMDFRGSQKSELELELERYIRAKRSAHAAGQPIPTFVEFQVADASETSEKIGQHGVDHDLDDDDDDGDSDDERRRIGW